MPTADELLAEVAGEDPLTRSYQGLDDYCLFCGSDTRSTLENLTRVHWARHDHDCLWVRIHDHLGLALPGLHERAPEHP